LAKQSRDDGHNNKVWRNGAVSAVQRDPAATGEVRPDQLIGRDEIKTPKKGVVERQKSFDFHSKIKKKKKTQSIRSAKNVASAEIKEVTKFTHFVIHRHAVHTSTLPIFIENSTE